ncbi:ATP-binding cassette domain-containing protein [Peptoniphilus sp. KCTC 25270]|uniref:ABC transporter ATP-binding protein n=1 Tax=Peptoniphilus sp. KCTC 25270 TaxID=2897414 RepID=UPI001E49B76A|nr:ABC transporter ATP-binding protein [Peptoniphilus sp. KCTC 25270]MCD1146807.1 ATP-binding cassette domain-containing protein [Peptoniphilus sp. KCTC 25270]
MEILHVEDFSFRYPEGKKDTLDSIQFQLKKGEFVLLCGLSGSGKTTLLRQLKPTLASHGMRKGSIYYKGKSYKELTREEEVTKIGFVQQNPENQVVTDKVWHELAFGLESLGLDSQTIRLRVGEIASFFGMEDWFYKNVGELSGGQLQMVNLASILVMQPEILLLDEPTSQLDPIAAGEFFQALKKINQELGITILLSEHRLGDVFGLVDRVFYMDEGKIQFQGKPREFGEYLVQDPEGIAQSLPIPTQIYLGSDRRGECPITVGEGIRWLGEFSNLEGKDFFKENRERAPFILETKEVFFRYEKEGKDVIRNVDFSAEKGKITSILGGNGAGKSTTLKLIRGLNVPSKGKILDSGKKRKNQEMPSNIALVPQNPRSLFVKKTVKEELLEFCGDKEVGKEKMEEMISLFRLESILEHHPYDISGGEQQRLAIAKTLFQKPEILLLDEPTKGMDGQFKRIFASVLEDLKNLGYTIIIVSHDIEFCAEVSDYCYLYFNGEVISEGEPHEFFRGNHFYTTGANKMCRQRNENIITVQEAMEWIQREGERYEDGSK